MRGGRDGNACGRSRELGEPGARAAAFIGRETELEWLLERVRHATRGRPRACLVRGEPGSGKSRLLAELGRQALVEGGHTGSLRGSPFLQTPYLALDALLKDLSAACPCGAELQEAREAWWRQLRERETEGEPTEAGFAAREQTRLANAFSRALLERASHGGFLLLVDDLQWLDGPSVELPWEAIRRADEPNHHAPACLALVAASQGPAARALSARMRAATGGGPRHLEERLAELRRQARLVEGFDHPLARRRRDLLVRRGRSGDRFHFENGERARALGAALPGTGDARPSTSRPHSPRRAQRTVRRS